MNINTVHRSFLVTLALGAALLSVAHAPARAQYLYFPNNATINQFEGVDIAVVGFPNLTDWSSHTHGTSPTISVVAGAYFGNGGGLESYNNSVVNVSGGSIDGLGIMALDSSTVNITGGTHSQAVTYDNATINVYAGATIPGAVYTRNGGTINVYGGIIGSSSYDSTADETGSTLNIYGGTFVSNQISISGGATLTISGGIGYKVTGYYYLHGILMVNLARVRYAVTPTLISSHAIFNGTSNWTEYQLSGQLGDGTSVDGVNVFVANDGSVFKFSNPPLF